MTSDRKERTAQPDRVSEYHDCPVDSLPPTTCSPPAASEDALDAALKSLRLLVELGSRSMAYPNSKPKRDDLSIGINDAMAVLARIDAARGAK
jgi:hypothetical protein